MTNCVESGQALPYGPLGDGNKLFSRIWLHSNSIRFVMMTGQQNLMVIVVGHVDESWSAWALFFGKHNFSVILVHFVIQATLA